MYPYTRYSAALAVIMMMIASALLIAPTPAAAHPADMYLHVHTITLTPDSIEAEWSIAPGPMLSFVVWDQADQDGDGEVSPDEARAWAEPLVERFYLILDGETRLEWDLETVEWPSSIVTFELGEETVRIYLSQNWPDLMPEMPDTATTTPAAHPLVLYNNYEEINSINWFYLSGADGLLFGTPGQQNGLLQLNLYLPDDLSVLPDADRENLDLRADWDSGLPALAVGGERVEPPKPQGSTGPVAQLTDLLRDRENSAAFYLTAFLIALGLGSLHALTPGHGKALVGAYLVGARGTMRHAVALGSIVTLTHTGSVLALGGLTLAASHILMPTTVFPILEISSGLLVVVMGLGLMARRWRAWRSVQVARRRRAAAALPIRESQSAPPHLARITLNPPVQANTPAPQPTTSQIIQINRAIPVNVYNDVLPQGDFSLSGVNWRSLVALGISGGLVPCPDAIAILLVAVALNQIILGLSLILAFSLGLAGILTAIGIALVRSQRLISRFKTFDRAMPALPLVSAVIVTGLGLALTASAISKPGVLGNSDKKTDQIEFTVGSESGTTNINVLFNADTGSSGAVSFDVERASVVFLATDEANRYQLYTASTAGGDPVPLTDEPFGVWDYQLSPDGAAIAYSAPQQYGGSMIWLINTNGTDRRQLLDCPEAVCSRPVWSPDGASLVHEKLNMESVQSALSITTLWWLDLASGSSQPVFRDTQLPGISPSWSPDGVWLSYVSPSTAKVQLYNLQTSQSRSIPSQTGGAVIWHPNSRSLLVTDIWTPEDGRSAFTHLMRYDLDSDTRTDLTGPQKMGDTWAAWSPDGEQVAVVRRVYSGPDASLGDQIWIMRPDGSEARPLTADADVIHGMPVWSPDGAYLLYQQYPLAGSEAEPGVWRLDVSTGERQQVAAAGNWPVWLP